MPLGHTVISEMIGPFLLDNPFMLIIAGFAYLFGTDLYRYYLRKNENTDNVDLMERYLTYQMIKRYKR